jgi:Undecaprenyl-phosphate galactose phosphotransferase WbaP
MMDDSTAQFSSSSAANTTRLTRQVPPPLSLMLLLADMCGIVVAMTSALSFTFWPFAAPIYDNAAFPNGLPLSYHLMLAGLLIAGCAMRGHYTQRAPWWTQMRSMLVLIVATVAFDTLVHISLLSAFPLCHILSVWGLSAAGLLLARSIALHLVNKLPAWQLDVALIGDAQVITDACFALQGDGLTGYNIKVMLVQGADVQPLDTSALPKGIKAEVISVEQEVDAFVREHGQYFYIISLEHLRDARRDRLMQVLNETGRDYAMIPSIKRLDLYGVTPHYFFGNDIMLLHRRNVLRQRIQLFLKRSLDVVATSFALPVIGLLTVAVWVVKKLEGSKSPLFYGGQRVGKDGKLFPCWKFCTMHPNADKILHEVLAADPAAQAEWDKYQKLRNDPRIDSSISALLRKTSLDEIPQLWNVFCGDMSLVGPRPIIPPQIPDLKDVYPLYISVRPGLTGLWQVSGRNETSFEQRIMWDRWYVQNWSIWHDIVILFKTVRVFLTGSGAY